jgi:hypothetical protein
MRRFLRRHPGLSAVAGVLAAAVAVPTAASAPEAPWQDARDAWAAPLAAVQPWRDNAGYWSGQHLADGLRRQASQATAVAAAPAPPPPPATLPEAEPLDPPVRVPIVEPAPLRHAEPPALPELPPFSQPATLPPVVAGPALAAGDEHGRSYADAPTEPGESTASAAAGPARTAPPTP